MLPRSSRLDPSYNVSAPFQRFFCIGSGLLAGEALEDDAGVLPNSEIIDGIIVILAS